MEIADIFVVNKADLPGANRTVREINAMLDMSGYEIADRPKVVSVVATEGEGISQLYESINTFLEKQRDTGAYQERRRDQISTELRNILHYELTRHIESKLARDFLDEQIALILSQETTTYQIADRILATILSKGEPQMLQKIDHLGVAVKSIAETLKFYEDALGITPTAIEEVPSQKVKVAFLAVGDSNIELLESTTEDGPIAKHIEKRGEGIAHLAFRVENVEEAMKELKDKGVRLLSDTPLPGAHGAKIVFIHPKSAHGILIELCERHD